MTNEIARKTIFLKNYELLVTLRNVNVANGNTTVKGFVNIIKRHEI